MWPKSAVKIAYAVSQALRLLVRQVLGIDSRDSIEHLLDITRELVGEMSGR